MKKYDLGYLSLDSIQEGVGASQVLRLVEEHSKNGLKVSLISFEKTNPPSWLLDRLEKSRINWVPLDFGNFGKLPAIRRLVKLRNALPDASVLHCRSDLTTYCANTFQESPVLWDIRSLWQEQRKILNPKQIGKTTTRVLDHIESINAKKSDAFTTLTRAVIPILQNRFDALPAHSAVVPTCVDLELFSPILSNEAENFVLVSGSFNELYDFDLTQKVLAEIKQQLGMEIVWIRGTNIPARSFGLREKVIDNLPHHEMPRWVGLSSLGIALCKSGDVSLKGAMPTKIAEFLSSGRPVVISEGIGDFDEIFRQNQVGVIISKNDDLRSRIEELGNLIKDPDTASKCRAVAEKFFNIASAAKIYAELYWSIS